MKDRTNHQVNPDPSVFTAAEEDLIRSRFSVLNDRLGLENETPVYAVHAFQRKLEIAEKSLGKPRSFGWRSIFLVALSSLSIGAIVTRATLIPSLEATRSNSAVIELKDESISYQLLKLKVDDPNAVGRSAAIAAVSAGLAIKTEESSNEFRLAIQGLSSLSPEHKNLKEILGINSSAQGNIYVTLGKP
jgi:hypothetical protein